MTNPLDDSERTLGARSAASPDDDAVAAPPRDRTFDVSTNALPAGTRLGEFSVHSVIGEGGFGIVYFAYDHSLNRQVAIKEYMPAQLAARTRALSVSVRSERHAETFASGLRSFINEARLLAQFDHPCLLKVYRFWEANGTAYMAMPYHPGATLAQALKQHTLAPDEAWLRDLLRHLLSALEYMHESRCYHRDIAPDNILIQPDGRPLLLDFGAARRVIGDMQRAPTVILKTGYAPVEQYGDVPDMPDMKQGPWTDLYALGALMHFAIAGQTPPPAVQRFLGDRYAPLAQRAAGMYSQEFLRAIDSALAVRPRDRPQSAAEMRTLLGMPEPTRGPGFGQPTTVSLGAPVELPQPAPEALPEPVPPIEPEPQAPSPLPAAATPAADADEAPLEDPPASEPALDPSWLIPAEPVEPAVHASAEATPWPRHAPITPPPAPPFSLGRLKPILAGAAVLALGAAVSVGLVQWIVGPDPATVAIEAQGAAPPLSPAELLEQNPPAAGPPPSTRSMSGTVTEAVPEPEPASPAVPLVPPAPVLPPLAVTRPATAPAITAPPQHAATRSTPRTPPAAKHETRPLGPEPSPMSRQCIDIIQRVSLGEPLSHEERELLKKECGQ